MKKVAIIGAHMDALDYIKIKEQLKGCELVHFLRIEDVDTSEFSDVISIQEALPFTNIGRYKMFIPKAKHEPKGHERKYKFHQ